MGVSTHMMHPGPQVRPGREGTNQATLCPHHPIPVWAPSLQFQSPELGWRTWGWEVVLNGISGRTVSGQ